MDRKRIVVGVSGGIAAYKHAPSSASCRSRPRRPRHPHRLRVALRRAATFEALSGNPVHTGSSRRPECARASRQQADLSWWRRDGRPAGPAVHGRRRSADATLLTARCRAVAPAMHTRCVAPAPSTTWHIAPPGAVVLEPAFGRLTAPTAAKDDCRSRRDHHADSPAPGAPRRPTFRLAGRKVLVTAGGTANDRPGALHRQPQLRKQATPSPGSPPAWRRVTLIAATPWDSSTAGVDVVTSARRSNSPTRSPSTLRPRRAGDGAAVADFRPRTLPPQDQEGQDDHR